MKYVRFPYYALILLIAITGAASAHRDAGLPDSDLVTRLDGLVHSDTLKHAFIGVMVQSLKDGRTLYSHESTLIYMPASCMKLVVSSAILEALGPDYRFKTELSLNGDHSTDTKLAGDLVLKGYGDSTLDTPGLAELADAVKKSGIKKVTGNLVVDDSYFDDQRLGWGWCWDDEPYYYSAQISALVLNRNTTNVWVKPAKSTGQPAIVSLEPPIGYFRIESSAVTGSAGSNSSVAIGRARGKNVVTVSGAIPLGDKPSQERITMEDPAQYVGEVLMSMLRQRGILVLGKVRHGRKPSAAEVLYTHYSDPLSKVLTLLNKPSDNLIAECLFKSLAAETKGEGTTFRAEQAELEFIKKIGGDPNQINISDGSGLSRLDMISPATEVMILKAMYNSPNSKVFMDSLPIAGVDGTLVNRMKGTLAEKNVRGKTGYVGRVSTITGYVTTKGGEPLAFSILMNHYTCPTKEVRDIQDQMCELLADQP